MHRRAALVVSLLVATPLALTGCTAAPQPQPVRTSATAPAPTVSSSPTATPLAIPGKGKAELLRATVTGSSVREEAADSKGARSLVIRVACSGAAGATMHWSLEDGAGKPFGTASTEPCEGDESDVGFESDRALPSTIEVQLSPDRVQVGYVIVERS